MKTSIRTIVICLASLFLIAAVPKVERLTPRRINQLATQSELPKPHGYKVSISGLGRDLSQDLKGLVSDPMTIAFPADKTGTMEGIREFRFPVEFEPPASKNDLNMGTVTPITPTKFETVNTGWTIRLSAKPQGKLIVLDGVADYVDVKLVNGGYGEIAGPVYSEEGEVLTANKLDQPRFHTTTTRFHIFALPGKPYEVILYRGAGSGKHTITIAPE